MIKDYIIAGIVSILVLFGIVLSIKCSQLEKENTKLKTEYNTTISQIKIENETLKKNVLLLQNDLEYQHYKIDSLKKVKQKVIIKKEYIVSENLTEGVEKLKENLR